MDLPSKCNLCCKDFDIPCKTNCDHMFDYDCLLQFIYNQSPNETKCPKCNIIINNIVIVQTDLIQKKVQIFWLSGHNKIFFINENCKIKRLRSLLSMGIFSSLNIINGIHLFKKHQWIFPDPYIIRLLSNGQLVLSEEIIKNFKPDENNIIKFHGLETMRRYCDTCSIDETNKVICLDESCVSHYIKKSKDLSH